ncbi:MAG: phospho-N-acetylmuramoyl-pentapeptide-transferase [Clostridia bacterium]|jgi:phospho-N-acetylmuramoyl-pentapeptide-transferase|nr:phospho-N-acetylmuramoyl-pentapeptide-transferase [Clostridia bacterium]
MEFQTKIILLSMAVSFIAALVVIPILKRLKVGQMERREGPQSHLKKQGTPTMGGIIMIITVLLIGILLCVNYNKSEDSIQKQIAIHLIPLILATVGFGIIGMIDDLKKLIGKNTDGLKPAYKMLGLLIVSVGFSLYLTQILKIGTDIYVPFFKTSLLLPIWLYVPFAVVVMLATTNAINLTDGIDGLSTSVTTIILTCLTVIGIILKIKEITVFGSILIGTCLSFLLFNLHPAKVMMGDTGSLLLGGAIASMALYLKMPLLLIIIALIPVLETLSVMIQVKHFKKTGKRIFKMTPIHHHFELSGWNENKIVSVFSFITLICCAIGLMAV